MSLNQDFDQYPSLARYLKLLLAFQSLPLKRRLRTFMEVSGYPHYENVSSNILSFYFDPAEEHGLGDLLISAFLQMTGKPDVQVPNDVSVYREFGADDLRRIDLVLDCESFTIGIENKIDAAVYNDLDNYGRVIDRLGNGKSIVVKAVLGLRPERDLKGGFVSYTYDQLWQNVRPMLGNYMFDGAPKWVTYLVDFMETTVNLSGRNMDLNGIDQFFIEHDEILQRLLAERNAFLNRLNQKVSLLASMMRETSQKGLLSKEPWVYAKSCLVLDFKTESGHEIAFDLHIRPSGWELQLFGRGNKSAVFLRELIDTHVVNEKAKSATLVNGRHIVDSWLLDTQLEAIKISLCSWIEAVSSAIKKRA